MVRPGGRRHPYARVRRRHGHEFQRLANGAGAARGGRRRPAFAGKIRSQDQPGHRDGKPRIAGQRDIGFRPLLAKKLPLGRCNRGHDRRMAGFIPVDAHAEVDLAGAGIVAEQGHQRQDRICALFSEVLEHQADPVATLRAPYMPHSAQEPS